MRRGRWITNGETREEPAGLLKSERGSSRAILTEMEKETASRWERATERGLRDETRETEKGCGTTARATKTTVIATPPGIGIGSPSEIEMESGR